MEYRSYELASDFPVLALVGEVSPADSGTVQRLHMHNCMEIGVCRSGTGIIVLEDGETPFETGFIYCIARNVPHNILVDRDQTSLWSTVYLNPEGLLGRAVLSDLPDPAEFKKMVSQARFMLPSQEQPWALPLVRDIVTECLCQKEGYRACVRGLVMALMVRLLRFYQQENPKIRKEQEAPVLDKRVSALSPALDYLNTRYAQSFPLETLAGVCGLSPTHFRRLFHAQMGTNPLNFLHQVRIQKSCLLLRETEKPVGEIAAQVGYTSLCCFNQHFQRIMGCPPSVWRKNQGK